jgi:hypothetical protein
MGNQVYFKIAGYVDRDMRNMFAVSTYHLSPIVFEKKKLYFSSYISKTIRDKD